MERMLTESFNYGKFFPHSFDEDILTVAGIDCGTVSSIAYCVNKRTGELNDQTTGMSSPETSSGTTSKKSVWKRLARGSFKTKEKPCVLGKVCDLLTLGFWNPEENARRDLWWSKEKAFEDLCHAFKRIFFKEIETSSLLEESGLLAWLSINESFRFEQGLALREHIEAWQNSTCGKEYLSQPRDLKQEKKTEEWIFKRFRLVSTHKMRLVSFLDKQAWAYQDVRVGDKVFFVENCKRAVLRSVGDDRFNYVGEVCDLKEYKDVHENVCRWHSNIRGERNRWDHDEIPLSEDQKAHRGFNMEWCDFRCVVIC